jgi:hypothetical protein
MRGELGLGHPQRLQKLLVEDLSGGRRGSAGLRIFMLSPPKTSGKSLS